MRKKSDQGDDAMHDATQLPGVLRLTGSSKSTVRRWLRGEIATASPFPRPFKIGCMKNNFWRTAEIVAWIDEQQQAGTK
jgi:predicted DNA-binding transcriptional regulator AlpA